MLHRNTDGNPLFLVNTVDDLIVQGQLREVDGQWRLSGAGRGHRRADAGRRCWQLVDKQVERLTADEQAVLVAASVAGVEFSAAVVVAAGIDPRRASCGARRWRGGASSCARSASPSGRTARSPGGMPSFTPCTSRCSTAASPSGCGWGCTCGRPSVSSAATGSGRARLPASWPCTSSTAVISIGPRGTERRPGEHALHQHAYREAADHATRGLESLRALPESRERAQRELGLQVTRGAGLTAIEGYGAPEVARTYARAWELCTQVGRNAADAAGPARHRPILRRSWRVPDGARGGDAPAEHRARRGGTRPSS